MKNFLNLFLFSVVLFLASCSGSDVYQGNWKATDADGNKYEMTFEPKKMSIRDSAGKVESYDYKQNSIKIKNSIKTYGIQLGDGRSYFIHFPIANETSKAIITLSGGMPVYTICRTSYIQYNDIFKLTK